MNSTSKVFLKENFRISQKVRRILKERRNTMGGREGTRGYLIQAAVAVINSLKDEEWDRVTLEPLIEKEKVDILWEYPDGRKKVSQVKSSINNFTENMIRDTIRSLITDVPDAERYEICLVGPLSKNAEKIKRQFEKNVFDFNDEFQENDKSISIEHIDHVSLSAIENIIYRSLDDKLSGKVLLTVKEKETQIHGLIQKFMSMSVNGETISRKMFYNLYSETTQIGFQSFSLEILNSSAWYQLRSIFEEDTLQKKLEAIEELKKLSGVLEDKNNEINKIEKKNMVFTSNGFSFVSDNFIDKEKESFKKGWIYIPGGRLLINSIINNIHLDTKFSEELMVFPNQNDTNNKIIIKLNEKEKFVDFIKILIEKGQIFSFLDGEWKHSSSTEVW